MPRDADGDPPSRTTPDGLLPRAALAGLVAVATAMAVTGCSVFGLDDLGSAAVDQAAQATGSDVGLGAPEDSDLDSSGTEDDEQVQRGADEDRSTDQPGAGATAGAAVLVAGPNGGAGPGPGALVGRLVDAVSGLPIRDTGVSLLAQERRTISGPDGSFRLDGVAPGPVTLVLGPDEDHVMRSIDLRLPEDGLDLGVTAMLPTSPPTVVIPEYGGAVTGCNGTVARFATDALSEPTSVRVTCLHSERVFPAPAPAGRLPLAAVDLSPADVRPVGKAQLLVGLPAQPSYAPGVWLDLLRLDPNRMIWVPDSTIVVGDDGETAIGDVMAFGTYMIAAPPYGAIAAGSGDGPMVHQFRVGAAPDASPSDVFPTGTRVVYATLDYALMEESPVTIRTLDSSGEPAFETSRQYTGGGRDNVPMSHGGGTWPAGSYVTTIYMTSGDQTGAEIDDGAAGSGGASTAGERPVHSIQWRVAVAPTDEPPLLPPVLPAQGAAAVPTSGAASSWPPDAAGQYPAPGAPVPCSAPFGWYTYVVQPGDTLIGLALRTGVSARRLMTANCMTSTVLYAGATIYVPRPPTRRASPPGPAAPTAPPWPTAWKGYPTPTAVYPPSIPTTWYTPPVATAPVPVDTVVPGAAGQPTPPTEPTAPGSAPPGSSPPAGPGATSVPTTGSLASPTANVPVPTSPPAPTEPAAPPPPTSAGAPAPTNPGPEPPPAPTEAPPQPPAAPPEPSQQPVPTDAPTQAPPAGSQELLRLAR